MGRDRLIQEVKAEYARLADLQSRERHRDQSGISPDVWYEKQLGLIISRIEAGQFDHFPSGREIIESVANNRRKWHPPS